MDAITAPALDERLSRLLPELTIRTVDFDLVPEVRKLIAADVAASLEDAPAVVSGMMASLRLDDWRTCHRRRFPGATVLLMEQGPEPVATAMIDWSGRGAIHILDGIVDPARRGRGLGGLILRGICLMSEEVGRPIRVTTLYDSRAARLLTRHGFVPVEEKGLDLHWERTPGHRMPGGGA